jgi:hypothetical protein
MSLSQENLQPCPCVAVSTPFIFESVQFQNAANQVYEYKVAYDQKKNARVTGKTYKFKTDFERMQALIGSYARNPSCGSAQQ